MVPCEEPPPTYSNAPKSGRAPAKGKPTFVPLSINWLVGDNRNSGVTGIEKSALRAFVATDVSRLAKSAAATVINCQLLEIITEFGARLVSVPPKDAQLMNR